MIMRGLRYLIVPILLTAGTWTLPMQAGPSARRLPATVNGVESTVPHCLEGLPTDWADRSLAYSQPSRCSDAYERVQSSPRYWLGQIRRATVGKRAITPRSSSSPRIRPRKLLKSLSADWSTTLGTGATVGAGMFPAKYTFNPIGAANCTDDFVVFNTSLPTTAVAASMTGTFTNQAQQGDTVTIGTVVLTAVNQHPLQTNQFDIGTNAATAAASLVAAITAYVSNVDASTTTNVGEVRVTAKTAGAAGNLIALAENSTRFAWTGGATSLAGGADGQATIAAFNNLYPGCGGTVPSLRWAYNTADAGTTQSIKTSVVLSSDGTQVAFVQAPATGAASLVVLKWRAGDGSSVTSAYNPTAIIAPSYRACTAPCRTSITFSGSNNVAISSPFYDYANDVIYVGDNGGLLHKFTGVFSGTPAEVITSPWPITVASGSILTGPIYDYGSKNIFVGASNGYLYYVRETGSTTGACGTGSPPCLGTPALDVSNGTGRKLVDPPMVDSTKRRVLAFTACSGSSGSSCGDGTRPAQAVQADTSLGNVVRVNIGLSSTSDTYNVRAGDFDNDYYTKDTGTGYMYVCGNPYESGARLLYQLSFSLSSDASTLQSASGSTITLSTNAASECSPVTEVDSTVTTPTAATTDWIFVSVPNSNAFTLSNCTPGNGCIRSFNVTTATNWPGFTGGSLAVSGGTSGIIVDSTVQSSTYTNTPNVYFSDLTSGLARQATQSGLQ
jgi:hypothetical protein